MKNLKNIYSTVLILLLLTSCGKNNEANDDAGYKFSKASMAFDAKPADLTIATTGSTYSVTEADKNSEERQEDLPLGTGERVETKIPAKIKKIANINITVDDYHRARTDIEKIIKAGNAYIGNEREQKNTYSINNDLVIRVMNKDFDGMVNKLLAVASNVNSKNISSEDVTAQYIDIQSRLKSKKEIEKRYLDILSKASKVADILEIEQKLGEIREQIEAKEGELKYLADQVDYSTINLTFHQEFEYTPTDRPGFFGRMGAAFGNGWSGLLSFFVGVIYLWPMWIILGLVAYFLVKFIKKQLKK